MRRFASALVVLGLALAAGRAAAAEATANATSSIDTAIRWAHPALWRIDSGSTTVYLFGSVHVLPGNIAWSDDEIDAAMHRSDTFVFEASLSAQAILDMGEVVRTKGRLPPGKTLREMLSPEGLSNYNAVMEELNIQPTTLDHFRPWFAFFYISLKRTNTRPVTAPGSVDPTVMSYAQSHGKEMRYLETARQQIEIFGNMDEETEVKTFEASLAQFHERPAQAASLIDAWSKGESEALAGMLSGAFKSVPAARRAIIDDRNRTWVTQIQNYLQEPNRIFFVTVGAGHFGGKAGVIPLLCTAGVHVTRVGRAGAPDQPACSAARGSLTR